MDDQKESIEQTCDDNPEYESPAVMYGTCHGGGGSTTCCGSQG